MLTTLSEVIGDKIYMSAYIRVQCIVDGKGTVTLGSSLNGSRTIIDIPDSVTDYDLTTNDIVLEYIGLPVYVSNITIKATSATFISCNGLMSIKNVSRNCRMIRTIGCEKVYYITVDAVTRLMSDNRDDGLRTWTFDAPEIMNKETLLIPTNINMDNIEIDQGTLTLSMSEGNRCINVDGNHGVYKIITMESEHDTHIHLFGSDTTTSTDICLFEEVHIHDMYRLEEITVSSALITLENLPSIRSIKCLYSKCVVCMIDCAPATITRV